ncbi:MAG: hypothetical protein ACYS21_19420, partial [Planctomycetota bacterium]
MTRLKPLFAVLSVVTIVLGAASSALGTSHDAAWTFGNDFNLSYLLQSIEPNGIDLGPIGAEDPNLTLHLGQRYQVTVTSFAAHPFQVIAKG